jgi:hypothetical protein
MRRTKAIFVVVVFLLAPMALFANAWTCACAPPYCIMAQCRTNCPMMQQHRCKGSALALSCNCMRYPTLAALIPLSEMILPAAAPRPGVQRDRSAAPIVALAAPPGSLPAPFHPPRA